MREAHSSMTELKWTALAPKTSTGSPGVKFSSAASPDPELFSSSLILSLFCYEQTLEPLDLVRIPIRVYSPPMLQEIDYQRPIWQYAHGLGCFSARHDGSAEEVKRVCYYQWLQSFQLIEGEVSQPSPQNFHAAEVVAECDRERRLRLSGVGKLHTWLHFPYAAQRRVKRADFMWLLHAILLTKSRIWTCASRQE